MKHLVLLLFAGLVIFEASAQRLYVTFKPNGEKTLKTFKEANSKSSLTASFTWRKDNVELEQIHYFPGGKRIKMQDNVYYDGNRRTHDINWIYTSKFTKTTYEYYPDGKEKEVSTFNSQDGKAWDKYNYRLSKYDGRNNRTWFKSWSKQEGTLEITSRFDYANGRTHIEEVRGGHRSTQSRHMFDVERQGRYGMSEYIAVPKTYHAMNGHTVLAIHQEKRKMAEQERDRSGRIVRETILKTDDYVNGEYKYSTRFGFEYAYDNKGRLKTLTIQDGYYNFYQQNRYEYSGDRLSGIKVYESKNKHNWRFIKSLAPNSNMVPTHHTNAGNTMATHSNAADCYHPQAGSGQSNPSVGTGNTSLLMAINAVQGQGHEVKASLFKEDAEKVATLVRVLNSKSDKKIGEAEVLSLALDLLIREYRDDIKDMHWAYLEQQDNMFNN